MIIPLKLVFNFLNIIVSLVLMTGGALWISHLEYHKVMVGSLLGLIGILNIIVELWMPTPIVRYAGFFAVWHGRGIFYVICGFVTADNPNTPLHVAFLIFGIFIALVGILYIILSFTKMGYPGPIFGGGKSSSSSSSTSSSSSSSTTTKTKVIHMANY